MMPLVRGILSGDRRSAARAITLIESHSAEREQILREIHPHTGRAYLVGITGPPGAGKSSLTDCLIGYLRRQGHKVGVVAVDPTSPFTGGAILGDRIRMNEHALDPGVFIRSMGTRGSLGGVAKTTKEAIRVLDAYGADVILVETVGVGQSELEIMNVADSVVLVLHPGAGDHIQALKAGIMEIADIFVVNKADLPGAEKTERQVKHMLELVHPAGWWPPVLLTTSSRNEGIPELWEATAMHRQYMQQSGQWDERRRKRRQDEIMGILHEQLNDVVSAYVRSMPDWRLILEEVETGTKDPYEVANSLLVSLTTVLGLKQATTGNE